MKNGVVKHFTFDAETSKDAIEKEIKEILERQFLFATYLQIHEPAHGKRTATVVCDVLLKGEWTYPRPQFKIITKQDAQTFVEDAIQPGTNLRIRDVNNDDMCWHIRREKGWAFAEIAHLPYFNVPDDWQQAMKGASVATSYDMRNVVWEARKSINKAMFSKKVSLL